MARIWLLAAALVLTASLSNPEHSDARVPGVPWCLECEEFWFYAIYGDDGDWWSGEQCVVVVEQDVGFENCWDHYEPGNILWGEYPAHTCHAYGRSTEGGPCVYGGNPGGGGHGGSLLADAVGLDGRVAIDHRTITLSDEAEEVRSCNRFLLRSASDLSPQ